MRVDPNKLIGEWRATPRGAKLFAKVEFINMTARSWITLDTTGQVVSIVCRQEWSAVVQTVVANLNVK